MKPIVLAFSGGLDTSWAIPYLAETTGRPVATVTVDTGGFDAAARAELAARAATLGAIEPRMLDGRADVAVLVIDAVEGLTAQDAHVGGYGVDEGVGLVVAGNKCDLVERDDKTFEV